MARFGQENERLAAEIGRMRTGGRGAPGDYKGVPPTAPMRSLGLMPASAASVPDLSSKMLSGGLHRHPTQIRCMCSRALVSVFGRV